MRRNARGECYNGRMDASMYRQQLKALLSPDERQFMSSLNSPHKIQDYLDALEVNFELSGETLMSARRVIREKKAHCIEAALLAAACLAYHGKEPLLLDLQTVPNDQDHVVTVFRENGLWGAISKTNHAILRWRDPVYKSVRELAMSYFHEYYKDDGTKSLLAYSKPFDLRRYDPACWVTVEEDLIWLAGDLDTSRHFPILSKRKLSSTRPASLLQRKILAYTDWEEPKSQPQQPQ